MKTVSKQTIQKLNAQKLTKTGKVYGLLKDKMPISPDFEKFENQMALPDIDITDEKIMQEVKEVRYAKK